MKIFIIAVFTALFFGTNLNAQTPDKLPINFVGRINDYMLKMVVNIETPNGFTGTGFIVSDNRNHQYLVTNKHMVGSWSLVDSFAIYNSISVSFYPMAADSSIKRNIPLTDKTGSILNNVKPHPVHDIDIVVIDITNVFEQNSNIPVNSMGDGLLIPLRSIRDSAILDLGSQIFTLGYPAGFRIAQSNYPIAKSAFIASPLTGGLRINADTKNFRGTLIKKDLATDFFLVDGLIIGGNSGGPIICPKDFYYQLNGNSTSATLKFKSENWVLGIVSFGWPGTGLTVVYPCDYILQLINSFR